MKNNLNKIKVIIMLNLNNNNNNNYNNQIWIKLIAGIHKVNLKILTNIVPIPANMELIIINFKIKANIQICKIKICKIIVVITIKNKIIIIQGKILNKLAHNILNILSKDSKLDNKA